MISTKILLMPIVGFLIGYFTNYIAIKMLFRPRDKILGIQGVFPKRKKQLAKKISDASIHIIPSKIRDLEKIPFIGPKILAVIKSSVENEINEMDNEKLEEIILKVAKRELRFITWMGGLIGFLIGLIQSIILLI